MAFIELWYKIFTQDVEFNDRWVDESALEGYKVNHHSRRSYIGM